jgi:hypothetical protein
LKTITTQLVSAAIWRRSLPADLDAWFCAQACRFLEIGLIARPKVLLDELSQAADAACVPDGNERRLFLSDVCQLTSDFANIVDVPNVDVRLKVTTEAALHAETMPEDGIRLLTVYHLASRGRVNTRTSADWQISNCGALLRLERSSVVLLKGRRGPERKREIARVGSWATDNERTLYLLEVRP